MKTSSERAIVHLNVTDFAVAVERIIDVTLRSRSLIITPSTNPRATVYDMSDEAWQDGVRKGMKLADALRRSPRALLRPPQPLLYEKAMISILRHARQFSPFIEHGRADGHFFLDLTGTKRLFGPPHDAASRLFREIDKQTGLQPIWTTATSKW